MFYAQYHTSLCTLVLCSTTGKLLIHSNCVQCHVFWYNEIKCELFTHFIFNIGPKKLVQITHFTLYKIIHNNAQDSQISLKSSIRIWRDWNITQSTPLIRYDYVVPCPSNIITNCGCCVKDNSFQPLCKAVFRILLPSSMYWTKHTSFVVL